MVTDSALEPQFDDRRQQRLADEFGMWLFLATELLFFGGLFLVYLYGRLEFPEAFRHSSELLDTGLGTLNTAVLLSSSFLVACADLTAESGRRIMTRALLLATAALGAVFLAIKGLEYRHEYAEGLVPFLANGFSLTGAHHEGARYFFNLYFVLTGLHALHVVIGVALILAMAAISTGGDDFTMRARTRLTALYWHFVDIVWIFLFPILYLVR